MSAGDGERALRRAAGPGEVRTGLRRAPFMVRWVVAVAASLVFGSGIEYLVAAQQLRARILEQAAEGYRADLAPLGTALSLDADDDRRDEAVDGALRALSTTHGTVFVGLFDATGRPLEVVGGEPEALEPEIVARVLTAGEPVIEAESDEEEGEDGRFDFLFAVASSQGPLLVEIHQREDLLGDLTGDLALRKLLGLLLGVSLAVPLSYLLGGRSLHRRQRHAEVTADTDALTGLAGRRPFRPALDAALARPADDVVLALLDIDDFKQVNDRLGHSYGDRVLCALAEAFGMLRASDVPYRLGGDEFAILLHGATEVQAAESLERVRRSFAERAPGLTFSAGVAASPRTGHLAGQELWERADAALYEAKARGRRRTVAFGDMTGAVTVSPEKMDAVRRLVADGTGLTVAFQPIWDLRAGHVLGHEALLRFAPGTPLDGPQEAFELAQRCGLAVRLDQLARRATFAAVAGRRWEGSLFVNVHPDALAGLDVDALAGDVVAAGLTAPDVILEIAEHDRLDRPESLRTLERARDLGFRLALDGMGQGNAGLRALTHVRFDVVKLDRRVVARLGHDPGSDATIAAATTFVRRTGGWVVAEGIEDARILDGVLGLHHAPEAMVRVAGQGCLLGRPVASPVAIASRLDLLPTPEGSAAPAAVPVPVPVPVPVLVPVPVALPPV